MNTFPSSAILTRNITRVFRSATAEQLSLGLTWYAVALRLATALSTQYGMPVRHVVGIIAALSPLNSWGSNVSLATRLIDQGGLSSGYLGAGLRKANLILRGADPESVLKSQKVAAFYDCILNGGQTDAVCVDRHALAIALNAPQADTRLTAKGYAEIAAAYVRAARILSRERGETVTPAEVQAVTWVTWRDRKFSTPGAFDPKS